MQSDNYLTLTALVLQEKWRDLAVDSGVMEEFLSELPGKALQFGLRILMTLIFFLIGVQVIKVLRKLVRKPLIKAHADTGLVQFLDSFLKVALYVVLCFMVASNFGVDAASIVALLGSAGVAIGLAIQGSLSNFAGGVLILLLKPFKVGDYIKEDSSGNEGTVSEIQMFYTKLLTTDNRTIIVPNGKLANSSMTNVTASNYRRLEIRLRVPCKTDIQLTREVILNVFQNDAETLKDREFSVLVDEPGEIRMTLLARCWLPGSTYAESRFRIHEQLMKDLIEAGILN